MNRKRIISAVLVLLSVLVCSSACQAADSPRQETESSGEAADLLQEAESTGEGAATSQPAESSGEAGGAGNAESAIGEFDFAGHTVLLNSGYTMPIMGLGTYSLDYDTCVNSVKTLLENGGDQRSGPQ